MQIYYNLNDYKPSKPVVATMGVFDGVHQGHLQIIKELKETALQKNALAVVITFNPHPRQVLQPTQHIQLLQSLEEKISRFEKTGIDALIVIPFTKEFSCLTAEQFTKQILTDKLHIIHFIIGHDHLFGKNRQGNFETLEQLGKQYGFSINQVKPFKNEHITISSSIIRESLENGDVKTAAWLLGYPYALSGTVVSGNKIGRSLGYPTANLKIGEVNKLVPAKGVYASFVAIDGIIYKGMTNIGYRPTLDATTLTIETNIFNFDKDIYGKKITVCFMERIRNEVKFEGLTHLQEQLARDKETTEKILRHMSFSQ